jgi:hypothetical protein
MAELARFAGVALRMVQTEGKLKDSLEAQPIARMERSEIRERPIRQLEIPDFARSSIRATLATTLPHIPVTRVWAATGMSGVPFGTQIA